MNLTDYVRQVSLEDLGENFCHQAEWNARSWNHWRPFLFPRTGILISTPRFAVDVLDIGKSSAMSSPLLIFTIMNKDPAFKQLLQRGWTLDLHTTSYQKKSRKKASFIPYRCSHCRQEYRQKRKSIWRKPAAAVMLSFSTPWNETGMNRSLCDLF